MRIADVEPAMVSPRTRRSARRSFAPPVGPALLLAAVVLASCSTNVRDRSTAGTGGASPATDRFGAAIEAGSSGGARGGDLGGVPGWDCGAPSCDWSEETAGAADVAAPGIVAPGLAVPSTTTSARGPGADGAVTIFDDNGEWQAFADATRSVADRHPASGLQIAPTRPPTRFRVTNGAGAPVLGASVEVSDSAGASLGSATTHADGTAVLPLPADGDGTRFTATARKLLASSSAVPFTGGQDVVALTLEAPTGAESPRVDVLFLVDASASMRGDLDQFAAAARTVVDGLTSLGARPAPRFALTAFRDDGARFVTRTFNFTEDPDAFLAALGEVQAGGGGDTPEALDRGLADALAKPAWGDESTVKVIVVFGDAPHRLGRTSAPGNLDLALAAAVIQGVKIHAVGAPGIDDVGEIVFRRLAQSTDGRFLAVDGPAVSFGQPLVGLISSDLSALVG